MSGTEKIEWKPPAQVRLPTDPKRSHPRRSVGVANPGISNRDQTIPYENQGNIGTYPGWYSCLLEQLLQGSTASACSPSTGEAFHGEPNIQSIEKQILRS